jgi:hypothetical protein
VAETGGSNPRDALAAYKILLDEVMSVLSSRGMYGWTECSQSKGHCFLETRGVDVGFLTP